MNKGLLGVAALSLGLAACSSNGFIGTYDPAEVAGLPGASTAFDKALQAGYVDLGAAEYAEYDWRDGDHFFGKAEAVTMGGGVGPDAVDTRWLLPEHAEELSAARSALVSALGGPNAAKWPSVAAEAQVAYDCWLQEQEENIQPEDIAACKARFEAAMAKLKVKPAAMPMAQNYTVWFGFDSSELTDAARKVVWDAAAAAKSSGGKVWVTGHTDTSGDAEYNLALSGQRAAAVKAELVAAGIAADKIAVSADGEKDLRVQTGDGVVEAINRRVEITIK